MTVGTVLAKPTSRRVGTAPRKPAGAYTGVLYILPSSVILIVILIVPILMSIYYSFTNYSVLGEPKWVGGENYGKLFTDAAFQSALKNTIIYTLISVPLQTFISLLVANLVAQRLRNRWGGFVRSVLFIPVMSSFVVVGTVWRFILGTDDGLVNAILEAFGLRSVNFLGNPALALTIVALVSVWKNIGYFLVIYYAGIMDVPAELYEASSIDGASRRQQFWSITVPALRPVTLLVVILGTIWSFQVFDLVYVMTGGGPGGATITLVMAVYQAGFKNFQMGYASAIAVILFLIVLAIAVGQRKVLGRHD